MRCTSVSVVFRRFAVLTAIVLTAAYTGHSAIFVVTNNLDSGAGSLRQAISNANAAGGGTIVFSNVNGTITLTSGELVSGLLTSTTILGPGSTNLAISGGGNSRVFNIVVSTVSISGLTLRDGFTKQPGGAVYNLGYLTMSNCLILANSSQLGQYQQGIPGGGGIYNRGDLNMSQCVVAGNYTQPYPAPYLWTTINCGGGGIYNEGAMYMTGCVVSNNYTGAGMLGGYGGSGGGIYTSNLMTITGCVITNNWTGNGGDASLGVESGSGGDGGGVYNAGTLVISNSSLVNNGSGSGGSTGEIAPGGGGGRGAGIFNANRLVLLGCLVSGNTSGNGGRGGNLWGPYGGGGRAPRRPWGEWRGDS
jgi:hypothetical protein